MARYIGQRIMTPTPGRLEQVINNQVKIFKSTDRRGSVAIAISGTDQDEVATNFIYDSISEVEAHQDGVLGPYLSLFGNGNSPPDPIFTSVNISQKTFQPIGNEFNRATEFN